MPIVHNRTKINTDENINKQTKLYTHIKTLIYILTHKETYKTQKPTKVQSPPKTKLSNIPKHTYADIYTERN